MAGRRVIVREGGGWVTCYLLVVLFIANKYKGARLIIMSLVVTYTILFNGFRIPLLSYRIFLR